MKILLFGLLLIALLASPRNSQCRIGENLEECKTRYGNPLEIKKDTALFMRIGMTVSVHFIDGKVDEIRYYKVNPKDSKKTIGPSEAEVNILLRLMRKILLGSWSLLSVVTHCGAIGKKDYPRSVLRRRSR